MKKVFYSICLSFSLAVLLACTSHTKTQLPYSAMPLTQSDITDAVNSATRWQLAHMDNFESYVSSLVHRTEEPRGWVQGTFFLGLARWAKATNNQAYFKYLREHGEEQNWQLGERTYHADDHVIAQYYLHLYDNDKNQDIIQPLLADFDQILSERPTTSLDFEPRGAITSEGYEHDCQKRWCWSDALFMSPPVWFHLSEVTGDDQYAAYADEEYRAVTEYLFDNENSLYFRDSRFFERREDNGVKIFWSRGNGWVYSGLTNIIDLLGADDPRRDWYIALFKRMSKSLAAKQASNGYWPVSLAAGELYKVPESSGTAFFISGLAWGVNNGLLDVDEYMSVIDKGWQALIRAQKADGMLGYVQQIGYAPDRVSPDQTQLYGVGAFLLAGTEMLRLTQYKKHSVNQ